VPIMTPRRQPAILGGAFIWTAGAAKEVRFIASTLDRAEPAGQRLSALRAGPIGPAFSAGSSAGS
jgi:hypothetical protein